MSTRLRIQLVSLMLSLAVHPSLLAQDCNTSMAIPPQGEGWIALFDGAPDGPPPGDWIEVTASDEGVDPVQEWRVEDGILVRDDGASASTHLYYVGPHGPWTDMELVCEFRTEIGTNSGVLFRVDGCESDGTNCTIKGANGLEAQINNTSTGATDHRTGAFFPDGDHLLDSPVEDNEWTHMRILVDDNELIIEINGVVTADYTINASNFATSGKIALQSEGLGEFNYDRIEFRSVYIRDLTTLGSCDGSDGGTPSNDPEPVMGISASDERLGTTLKTIAHYHFDGDFQNSAQNLYHLRGYGNAQTSSTNVSWMASPEGQALELGGVGDKFHAVFHTEDINPFLTEGFTIDMLIYVEDMGPYGNYDILQFHQSTDNSIFLRRHNNNAAPALRRRYNDHIEASVVEPFWKLNQWMHVQVIFDPSGSKLQLHIDGMLVGEDVIGLSADGKNPPWSLKVGNFAGYLDEIRVSLGNLNKGATTSVPFDNWKERFFSSSDLNDPSKEATLWGDDADADGDGFTTLAEYCLGLHPVEVDGLDAFSATPTANPVVVDYLQAKQATGTTVKVLGSNNLGSWSEESVMAPTMTNGLLFDRMQFQLTSDYSAVPRRFFAIGVSRTP